nr:glycosyltransferase [Pedobacter sp. ASV12]
MSSALQSRLSGKIDFDSYIKITKESMVTLGVSRYPSFRHSLTKPDTYSRLRDIEAPMLGACYLTEYTAGLEELYDLGSEIETYSNVEEMAQKIEKLQKDKQLRLQLRNMGQKRALSEHSIANSLAKIKLQLNIK